MVPSKAPNPANPSKRVKLARGAAKLWAVASQVFPFLLARGCRTNAPNPPNISKPFETCQTGSWSCQTGSWSCQTMGCGKPSLSFSTGPKLPDGPFKHSGPSGPLGACWAGSWSCQTMVCGKPSLSFGPFKPFKTFKTCQTEVVKKETYKSAILLFTLSFFFSSLWFYRPA